MALSARTHWVKRSKSMLLHCNKHAIGHEEHSNNSVKSILLPGKVEGKGRHKTWMNRRTTYTATRYKLRRCLRNLKELEGLVENMRRIKSGLSRKMFHHFWMFACRYTVNKWGCFDEWARFLSPTQACECWLKKDKDILVLHHLYNSQSL